MFFKHVQEKSFIVIGWRFFGPICYGHYWNKWLRTENDTFCNSDLNTNFNINKYLISHANPIPSAGFSSFVYHCGGLLRGKPAYNNDRIFNNRSQHLLYAGWINPFDVFNIVHIGFYNRGF